MAPGRAESDFGLQGLIDILGLQQIFFIISVCLSLKLDCGQSFQSDPSVYFTSFTKTIYSPMAAALATALEQKALQFLFLRFVKTKTIQ